MLRPKDYLAEVSERLRREGFEVVAVPFLKVVPNEEGIRKICKLKDFDAVIVTSRTSARILIEHEFKHDYVIAIGKKTAEILRSAGINPKIPSKFDSKTLYEEFKDELMSKRVAIVRSDRGDPVLLKLPDVEEIVLYRIEFEHGEEQKKLIDSMDFDIIVFSSSMMVKSFFELAKEMDKFDEVLERLKRKIVVAIGPPTKKTLESYGIQALMPDEYSFDGVIKLLKTVRHS
ncbi:uroporphyrinogen-III synthase [Archaeoglobales archaeon]|nr:MAG: uroporphyrinogen-III synthase [Archaeoglobales archaeon]